MNKRIVYTRPDGCVSVCCPSDNAIRWMGTGGRWPDATRGWLDQQVERQISDGIAPDTARRHVRAMMWGGLTTAEALGLIRDRDCSRHGTGIELWDRADVPSDRWFRNAWRRGQGGGPIWIDLPAARIEQMRRAVNAAKVWNQTQEISPQNWGANGPHTVSIDYSRIKRLCDTAQTLGELRSVWPEELPFVNKG